MYFVAVALLGFAALANADPSRIVGGRDVDIADYPWQLALEVWDQQFCGASILNENWALTAAHCFDNTMQYLDNMYLRAGSSDRQSGGSKHFVSKLAMMGYDKVTKDYDVALLKVRNPFPLGQRGIQKIAFTATEPQPGARLTVSGWGHTRFNGTSPASLKAVDLDQVSRPQCQRSYAATITNRMICAGIDAGGKDSCQGDSGGPLVDLKNKVQYGIVSFGAECGLPHVPGVYSNIANQDIQDFINKYIST